MTYKRGVDTLGGRPPLTEATPGVAAPRGTAVIIADPQLWSAAATRHLEDLGLRPLECRELHEALDIFYEQSVLMLVVAVTNPELVVRGCRSMRGLQEVPLLAVVPRESDVVLALEAGADDSIPAAASGAVLTARVKALLRRASQQGSLGGQIFIRDLRIDLNKCQVTLRDQPVNLTPTEFRLLACLAQRAGRVVDSRTLLRAVHGYYSDERDAQSVVKVHIANIRRKLEALAFSQQAYILSVRGFGYLLERRALPRGDDPLFPLMEAPPGDGPD